MKPDRIAMFEIVTLSVALVAVYLSVVFAWVGWLAPTVLHVHWFTALVVNFILGWQAGCWLRPVVIFFGRYIKYDQLVREVIAGHAAEDRKNGVPEDEIRRRRRAFIHMARNQRRRIMTEADKP